MRRAQREGRATARLTESKVKKNSQRKLRGRDKHPEFEGKRTDMTANQGGGARGIPSSLVRIGSEEIETLWREVSAHFYRP